MEYKVPVNPFKSNQHTFVVGLSPKLILKKTLNVFVHQIIGECDTKTLLRIGHILIDKGQRAYVLVSHQMQLVVSETVDIDVKLVATKKGVSVGKPCLVQIDGKTHLENLLTFRLRRKIMTRNLRAWKPAGDWFVTPRLNTTDQGLLDCFKFSISIPREAFKNRVLIRKRNQSTVPVLLNIESGIFRYESYTHKSLDATKKYINMSIKATAKSLPSLEDVELFKVVSSPEEFVTKLDCQNRDRGFGLYEVSSRDEHIQCWFDLFGRSNIEANVCPFVEVERLYKPTFNLGTINENIEEISLCCDIVKMKLVNPGSIDMHRLPLCYLWTNMYELKLFSWRYCAEISSDATSSLVDSSDGLIILINNQSMAYISGNLNNTDNTYCKKTTNENASSNVAPLQNLREKKTLKSTKRQKFHFTSANKLLAKHKNEATNISQFHCTSATSILSEKKNNSTSHKKSLSHNKDNTFLPSLSIIDNDENQRILSIDDFVKMLSLVKAPVRKLNSRPPRSPSSRTIYSPEVEKKVIKSICRKRKITSRLPVNTKTNRNVFSVSKNFGIPSKRNNILLSHSSFSNSTNRKPKRFKAISIKNPLLLQKKKTIFVRGKIKQSGTTQINPMLIRKNIPTVMAPDNSRSNLCASFGKTKRKLKNKQSAAKDANVDLTISNISKLQSKESMRSHMLNMTCAQLKTCLRVKGGKVSGKKSILIERMLSFFTVVD